MNARTTDSHEPLAEPNVYGAEDHASGRVSQANLDRLKILIIDDSRVESRMFDTILTREGHEVIFTEDGKAALSMLSGEHADVDLILLDVIMPGIDGYEVARRIRIQETDDQDEWRPIIFMSGRHDADDIAGGIEAGGDDFLAKPVDAKVLKAKILAMQRIATMRRRLIEAQDKLARQAATDELTGLPNRRDFIDRLHDEIARASRHHSALSIAYLDIDHFKNVNDTHGHHVGDAVLRGVSSKLAVGMRDEDFIGRLGGEEFCICMPHCSDDKDRVAERYRRIVEDTEIHCDGVDLKVTASFGVTEYHNEDTAEELLKRSDEALYEAKESGRNRVVVR